MGRPANGVPRNGGVENQTSNIHGGHEKIERSCWTRKSTGRRIDAAKVKQGSWEESPRWFASGTETGGFEKRREAALRFSLQGKVPKQLVRRRRMGEEDFLRMKKADIRCSWDRGGMEE